MNYIFTNGKGGDGWIIQYQPYSTQGGGGVTTFQQFSPEVFIKGGSNYTLDLSFVITEHLKLDSGQKKISYGMWEAAEVGWVLDFSLNF